MTNHYKNKKLLQIAKRLKEKLTFNATKSEIMFQGYLRKWNVFFSFQHIIFVRHSFFIADFVVTSLNGKKYLIELDGGVHFNYQAKKKDRNRSSKIRMSGYGVLRFKNDDVLTNPEKVYKKLKRYEII